MGRRSSIETLPDKVQDEVHRLIRKGTTIDVIVEHLQALNQDVSRSAVGRFKKRYEDQLKRYREAQEVAGVWVAKLGEDPKGDVGRLLQEMLKTVAFQTLAELGDDEAEQPGARDLHFLARTIKDLEAAGKISADREIKIRREVAEQAVERLDEIAGEAEAAGEKGLSAERVAQLRREFLGVGRPEGA